MIKARDQKNQIELARKRWLKTARERSVHGALTHAQLASRLGTTTHRVRSTEDEGGRRPRFAYLLQVATVTGVSLPEKLLEHGDRNTRSPVPERDQAQLKDTVDEEIREIARALAARCFPDGLIERNAEVMCVVYGVEGKKHANLTAAGYRMGITRERCRQIVTRMVKAARSMLLKAPRFDDLARALEGAGVVSVQHVRADVRKMLGKKLSLLDAQRFGTEVLGRSLELSVATVHGSRQAPRQVVVAGDAQWLKQAASTTKLMIRRVGAAQISMVWALAQRSEGRAIDAQAFERLVTTLPGFRWLDRDHSWYIVDEAFSENAMIDWTVRILAVAGRPVGAEELYAGFARMVRPDMSQHATDLSLMPPIDVVRMAFRSHSKLRAVQYDLYALKDPISPEDLLKGAALTLYRWLAERDGMDTRASMQVGLVQSGKISSPMLQALLSTHPMIRRVDGNVMGLRGWPIDHKRLEQCRPAPPIVAPSPTPPSIPDDEPIAWTSRLTPGVWANYCIRIPARFRARLRGVDLVASGSDRRVRCEHDRVVGLIPYLRTAGIGEGDRIRINVDLGAKECAVSIADTDRRTRNVGT